MMGLEEILEDLRDVVILFNKDGRVEYINKVVEDFGLKKEDVLGKPFWRFIDERFIETVKRDLMKMMKGEEVENEVCVITPKGRRWVEYKSKPVVVNGRIVRYQSVLRDIDDRKRHQEELSRMYEFTRKISSLVDPEDIFRVAFEEFRKFIEFDAFNIGLVNRERNTITIEFSIDEGRKLPRRSYRIAPDASLSSWVVYHGKPLLIKDFGREAEKLPIKVHVVGRGSLSWLGIPLIFKNEVIGMINIQSYKRAFDERDMKLLRRFTEPLAMAIANALLYRDLKRREESVKEEREKYKKILENLIVGIVIIHRGRVIYANKMIKDALGYEMHEVIGENFIKFVHPEMRDYVLENYTKRAMGLPAPTSYILKLLDREGNVRYALINVKDVEWEGVKAELISLLDITRLKNMESTLKKLAEVFRDIKMATTLEDIYSMTLETLTKVLKFPFAEISRLEGDTLVLIGHVGNYADEVTEVKINSEKGVIAWVARHRRPYYVPDVTKEPMYLPGAKNGRCEYASPIVIENKLWGVIDVEKGEVDSITHDERNLVDMLAEHVAVAIAGLEKQRELERAKNFQELMVHIISHDLKNPLSVAKGYVELLYEEVDREYLDELGNSLEESFRIIDKVRLFSRLGNRRIKEERRKIELRGRIEDIISTIKRKYRDSWVEIDMPPMEIEGYTIVDGIFTNLLDNAFKYGATQVWIKGKEMKDRVEIRVADNGPGIPEKIRERIFEPFERASVKEGSGLGLAIVKMIAELHNGKVWVEDNEPRGSVFVVQLSKG